MLNLVWFIVIGYFMIMTAVITPPLLSLSITETHNVPQDAFISFWFVYFSLLPEGPGKDIFLITGCKYMGVYCSFLFFFKNPQVLLLSPPWWFDISSHKRWRLINGSHLPDRDWNSPHLMRSFSVAADLWCHSTIKGTQKQEEIH